MKKLEGFMYGFIILFLFVQIAYIIYEMMCAVTDIKSGILAFTSSAIMLLFVGISYALFKNK